MILAFALCAVSVTVLTGWAGQLSLGQMAFAGIGALSAAALVRGATLNIGWRSHRLAEGSIRPIPMALAILAAIAAIGAFSLMFAAATSAVSARSAIAASRSAASSAPRSCFPIAIDRSGDPAPAAVRPRALGGRADRVPRSRSRSASARCA